MIMIIIILIIIIIILMMITKDYNNPKTITMISELNIGQWVRNPPPPPHSFRVRICLFPPFESTPLSPD